MIIDGTQLRFINALPFFGAVYQTRPTWTLRGPKLKIFNLVDEITSLQPLKVATESDLIFTEIVFQVVFKEEQISWIATSNSLCYPLDWLFWYIKHLNVDALVIILCVFPNDKQKRLSDQIALQRVIRY